MEIPNMYQNRIFKTLFVLLIILCAFVGVKTLGALRALDRGALEGPTITLSGHGEVQAVPDVASIYFSVESSKATQDEASNEVNTKTKKVIDFLKSSGVAEKDIKTEGYNSYPKYSNPTPCPLYYPQSGVMRPCESSTESKIIGYTVSENVNVKIRKADDAAKIVDGINKIGVTNMSGPNFTIDDEDALRAEARQKAIADAKEKAQALAHDLGVHLGKVQSFSENGVYPGPYYEKMSLSADSGGPVPPELPKGENTISSDVTITYEIR